MASCRFLALQSLVLRASFRVNEKRAERPHRRRRATARRVLPRLLAAILAATIVLGGGLRSTTINAQDGGADVNREYAIKAAYLYQFSRYVQWPAESFADNGAPLVIGVLGSDPFGDVLAEIARSKRMESRPIVVRRFDSMAQYTPCHILFISASVSAEEKAAAIRKLKGIPTLTVGEEPAFAEQGGMINFFLEENRIRFEINDEVAKQDQLKISSKLLSLAKIVSRH
jgi:hypothetical protein